MTKDEIRMTKQMHGFSSITLTRYAEIIQSMIATQKPFEPTAEDPSGIQVERGLNLPVLDFQRFQMAAVVDAGGHARPVYRPLLVYSWLLAIEMAGGVREMPDELYRWIDSLDEGIWFGLVIAMAGILFDDETWRDAAAERFNDLVDHQQQSGGFLPIDSRANPETRWYEELVLLHAVASYAVRVNDERITAAAAKAAVFHLQETQPDHASAQPWGLLAFARFAPPLADQMLHAMTMQYPAGVTGVPLLLLTDALYGLRRLIERERIGAP